MIAAPERYVVLRSSAAPLGGRCPVCRGVLDETGCRLGEQRVSRDPARTHGVTRIVEVFCTGVPVGPVAPCACCTEVS